MSQPKVRHRCASMDAQIAPHDGTPELMEVFDRMSDRAHDAVLGDPEEEHCAACSEDASRNEQNLERNANGNERMQDPCEAAVFHTLVSGGYPRNT